MSTDSSIDIFILKLSNGDLSVIDELSNQKSELQYQLMKLQFKFMEICEVMTQALKPLAEVFSQLAANIPDLQAAFEKINDASSIPQRRSSSIPPKYIGPVTYTEIGNHRSRDEIRRIRRKLH